jgi:hypothetical protein
MEKPFTAFWLSLFPSPPYCECPVKTAPKPAAAWIRTGHILGNSSGIVGEIDVKFYHLLNDKLI